MTPSFNLTQEQILILEKAKLLKQGQILKINACAGSGKTFTLKQIALTNPKSKFLYLAFNKTIAEQSLKTFPMNVEVKTIHALAYAFVKKHYENFTLHPSNLKIFDIAYLFPELRAEQLNIILKLFNDFLKSDAKEPSHQEVAKIANAMMKGELGFTHDFYLKLYALAQKTNLKKYDFLLLDEAQDSNAVMLSIFLHNPCKKILVGDTFQNIYGFNQTVNAIEKVKADFSLNLSTSFRSTQDILDYADSFLDAYSTKTKVKMQSSLKKKETIKTQAFISRTNAGLIEMMDSFFKEKANLEDFALLKEPESIFRLLFDIFYFRSHRFEFISKENAFLHHFNSMSELRSYANYDTELSMVLNLSEKKYDFKSLKKLAFKLYRNKKAHSFLINAHLSKGLEWDRVTLHNDFPNLEELQLKIFEEKNLNEKDKREFELEQELNLFYVAITRTRFELVDKTTNLKEKSFLKFFPFFKKL